MLSLLMHVHNLIKIHQLIHKILSINKILTLTLLTLLKTSEKCNYTNLDFIIYINANTCTIFYRNESLYSEDIRENIFF